MASAPQRPDRHDGVLSTLDGAIQILNLAKDACGILPAQAAFSTVIALLAMIRDSTANKQDHVDLGLCCADVCRALDRGLSGRRLDDLSRSMLGAIEQLTTTVAKIQRKIFDKGKRRAISRVFHAKVDKDTIAAWRQDLNRILHIFNTELLINNNIMLSDIHRNALAGQEGSTGQYQSAQASVPPGESPPPPPRACFGREETIEEIVRFAENLEPVALIGAGGIGKTSIALKVLHHDRIKDRFGDNRRFIRCDQFPASRAHLLNRLSKVIGAGIENPEDLTPLRPFLSSSEMILFLDNAESIFDPAGPDAREIYTVVEELTRFDNICLGITSRISTVPPHCKRPAIPTLSIESACDIFYGIYNDSGQSDIISNLVRQLDFHALSITLLATVASHNVWDYGRLAKEWETQRARVLRTDHNESLAATIELSLSSQTFRKLTPSLSPSPSQTSHKKVASSVSDQLPPSSAPQKPAPSARELLEVIAFFPQGVDENNLDWLFPTIPNRKNVLDKFCLLSLTYRNNGFVTMLAPIRDYLTPKDPKSSPLLRATKDRYFSRLSVEVAPGAPGFGEARWIVSEDVNVEHLLDMFASIDPGLDDIWNACCLFMTHLYWFKPRETVLGSKIEGLPDDHPFKLGCLFWLSMLFDPVGNHTEQKRLLTHTLKLARQWGSEPWITLTIRQLSDVNRVLGGREEGIKQAKEALEISERLGDTIEQARCLDGLAWLLLADKQFDAAGDAASRAIDLISGKDQKHLVCQLHRVLGEICLGRGEREKAAHHFETALGIASPFDWRDELYWIHFCLACIFCDGDKLDSANAHIEQAKLHTFDGTYKLGRAMKAQACYWGRQGRLEEAKSEAFRALEVFEKLGAAKDVEECRSLLQETEKATESRLTRRR